MTPEIFRRQRKCLAGGTNRQPSLAPKKMMNPMDSVFATVAGDYPPLRCEAHRLVHHPCTHGGVATILLDFKVTASLFTRAGEMERAELQRADLAEAKKQANRAAARKSRKKKHFDEAEARLNGTVHNPFPYTDEHTVQFTTVVIVAGRVWGPTFPWKTGYRRSVAGRFREYGSAEEMEKAVIVHPSDSAERIAVDANRIKKDPPVDCVVKFSFQAEGCQGKMLTGPCPAPDEEEYILVRFDNGEHWWVHREHVLPLESGERKRYGTDRFDPVNYKGSNIIAGEKKRNLYPHVDQGTTSRTYMRVLEKAREKLRGGTVECLEEATAGAVSDCSSSIRSGNDRNNIHILARTTLLLALCNGGDWRGYLKSAGPLDIPRFWSSCFGHYGRRCPYLEAFRRDKIEQNCGAVPSLAVASKPLEFVWRMVTSQTSWLEFSKQPACFGGLCGEIVNERRVREKTGKKRQREVAICLEDGCKTPAHKSGKKYCLKHTKEPPKMCGQCNKNVARRSGGVCFKCYVPPESDNEKFCQGCLPFGRKNKPRTRGGLCSSCISLGMKLKKKCTNCKTSERKYKGGLCLKCSRRRSGTAGPNAQGLCKVEGDRPSTGPNAQGLCKVEGARPSTVVAS